MALETDTIANECYDFASIIEKSELVIVNEPLIIYSSDSSEDDCKIVQNPYSKPKKLAQSINLPKIVFDGNNFQFKDTQECSELNKNLSLSLDKEIDDGLAVLEILCSHNALDRPEFVDINKLTEASEKPSLNGTSDILELSDEDDDVVFVKEYKEAEKVPPAKITDNPADKEVGQIRRNPVRNARNKSKDLSKDLLYEEDFAILDASDDELNRKENKPPERKSASFSELPKEWPVNVHERPEYNTVTKKIEPLDYTIRDIQKRCSSKKMKLDIAASRKKSKKKTVVRKKKMCCLLPEEEKLPLETLIPLVNSTTDMLKDYFIKSKQHKDLTNFNSAICTFENKVTILKNQALLFSVVNNLDQNEVVEKFKQLNVDIETKD